MSSRSQNSASVAEALGIRRKTVLPISAPIHKVFSLQIQHPLSVYIWAPADHVIVVTQKREESDFKEVGFIGTSSKQMVPSAVETLAWLRFIRC